MNVPESENHPLEARTIICRVVEVMKDLCSGPKIDQYSYITSTPHEMCHLYTLHTIEHLGCIQFSA
jgi:hypothetical protein